MRSVSLMALLVTPKSAALAKSGRTIISGRIKLAVDAILPIPAMPRISCVTASEACCNSLESSPLNISIYFSPEPPKPTLVRTPGKPTKVSRISLSMICLRGRSPRSSNKMVSVASLVSAAPELANASDPALPPPIAV